MNLRKPLQKYRSIDNDWDLDEFHCERSGKLYVNGELKANLLRGGGVHYINDGLLVERVLFSCYGAGLYRIEEECSISLVRVDIFGVIIADCWRCGSTLYFYFQNNEIRYMHYDFISKQLMVNYKHKDGQAIATFYPDKTIITTNDPEKTSFDLKEHFFDYFDYLCKEVDLDLDVEQINLDEDD